MKYKIKKIDDVAVFSLSGRMMGDKLTSELYDEAKKLISKGVRKLVIDLLEVDFINSIGLGMIIACRTSMIKVAGSLKILCTSTNIEKYFKITELDQFFEFYDSEEEALESYSRK
jgi:anti-sigma B factor antagonist